MMMKGEINSKPSQALAVLIVSLVGVCLRIFISLVVEFKNNVNYLSIRCMQFLMHGLLFDTALDDRTFGVVNSLDSISIARTYL